MSYIKAKPCVKWKSMKNAKQQAITDLNVLNGYRDV